MKKLSKKIKIGQKLGSISTEELNMKNIKKEEIEEILNNYSKTGVKFEENREILMNIYQDVNEKYHQEPWEYQSILDYRAGGYYAINYNCRKFISMHLYKKAKNIEKEIKYAPKMMSNMIVFRFLTLNEFEKIQKCQQEGKIYVKKGFMSCSISSEFPGTMEIQIPTRDRFTMILKISKGTEAIYFDDSVENEILIQKNTKIQIKKIINDVNRRTIIIAEIKK